MSESSGISLHINTLYVYKKLQVIFYGMYILSSIVNSPSAHESSYDHSTCLHTYGNSAWDRKYSVCMRAKKQLVFFITKKPKTKT